MNPDACFLAQGFGENGNASYAANGLKGHTGQDQVCGFHIKITSPKDQHIYKVLTAALPARDGSGFTGAFGIVDDGVELYELLEGHCDPLVNVGDDVKKGQDLGLESNHGTVYSGGQLITLAMQKAGDQRGHHRHVQKRPVKKVKHTQIGERYLDCYSDSPAGTLFRDLEGNYYEYWYPHNGYNGCVDPAKSVFLRDLSFGATGYDVFVLQRILVKQGFGVFEPSGYFGNITLAAVRMLQSKLLIKPDAGYFGPRTRAALQAIYGV